MKKFIIVRTVLLLLIALSSTNLWADKKDKMRIAVLEITTKNAPKSYGQIVRDVLEISLHKTGAFEVLERNQIDKILKEQGFQMTGCTDTSCAVQIGKMLSADLVVIGTMTKITKFTLMIKFVGVRGGSIVIGEDETANSEDEIEDACRRLSSKVAGLVRPGMKTNPPDEEQKPKEEPKKEPAVITAGGYYMRGVIPGWGQWYAGSPIKGFVYSGCFVITGAAFVYAYIDYDKKKSDYHNLPGGTAKSTFDNKYDAYKNAANVAIYTVTLFTLSYIANWVDLIFFTRPEYGKSIGMNGEQMNSTAGFNIYATTGMSSERITNLSFGMKF
jgi:hypothetical protein